MPYKDAKKNAECKLKYQREHLGQHREESRKWREQNPEYGHNYFENNIKSDPEKYGKVMTKLTKTFDKYKEQWKEIKKGLGYDKCSICGYNKCQAAIEYHHPNPETKKYPPSLIFHHKPTEEWISTLKELVPLCANCHREIHYLHMELRAEEE